MIKRFLCFAFLLFVVIYKVKAQYYEIGTEPFGTRWRSISAKSIRLIFPSTAEGFAPNYLNSLLIADSLAGIDYNVESKRIDVVLHNGSALANGFVSWAPRRMELYSFPLDADNAEIWHNHLPLHEMRHVKQMYRLNANFYRALSFLIGQQAVGLAASHLPTWFLEGDAVYTETKYTNSGRGRNGAFYQYYRAHYLTNEKYFKYDKWLYGSYRHFIPNQYNYGYQMVNYVYSQLGSDKWNKVLDFVSKWPITISSFHFGCKVSFKLTPRELNYATFSLCDSLWTATFDSTSIDYYSMSPHNKVYTNYLYPYRNSRGCIIAYKTSLNKTPKFVNIDSSQKETTITRTNSLIGNPFINDSIILWSERKADIRWEQISYGRVVMFNYITGKKIVFRQRGIFYSPIYYSNSVVALFYENNGEQSIVKLGEDGTTQTIYCFENGFYPQDLKTDGKKIYVSAVTIEGKLILEVDDSGARAVIPPTSMDINSFCVSRGNIYFSSTNDYCENIFCHNIQKNKTYKVVNSKFGSRYPSIDACNDLIFSTYSTDGYSVASCIVNLSDSLQLQAIKAAVPYEIETNKTKISMSNTSSKIYKSDKYGELQNLVNIHSWIPAFVKPISIISGDEYEANFGATILSQNLTGTTVFTAGYGYNSSADYKNLFNATIQYSGFYPKIYASFDLEPDNAFIYKINSTVTTNTEQRKKLNFYITIPLYLTSNNYITYLMPFSDFYLTNDKFYSSNLNKYNSSTINWNNGLYFSCLTPLAHRDLQPRLGTSIKFTYISAPFNKNNLGNAFALISKIYLPSIFTNHSIMLKSSIQHQNLKNYYLHNSIDFPRGYNDQLSEDYSGISANYTFPLCYPDLNALRLAYIKRFSLNLFYDYGLNAYNFKGARFVDRLSSFGFELRTDFYLSLFSFPCALTCRMSLPYNNSSPIWWFGINFDFKN